MAALRTARSPEGVPRGISAEAPADLILRVLTRRIIEVGARNQAALAPEQVGRTRKSPHKDGEIRQDAQRTGYGPDAEVYTMRRNLDVAGVIVPVFVHARQDEGACEDTRRLFPKDDSAVHTLARDNTPRTLENSVANCFL
jgi:hypothetical protein